MNSKTKTSAHVVLGLDKDGKARAALVHPTDLEAAAKAAASLGFKLGRADSPHALQMAKRLPDAKVFATGKGLVSLVRKDIFEWLTKGLTMLETKAEAPSTETKAAAASDGTTASSTTNGGDSNADGQSDGTTAKPDPKLWDQIKVGSVVIAPVRNVVDDGYPPRDC